MDGSKLLTKMKLLVMLAMEEANQGMVVDRSVTDWWRNIQRMHACMHARTMKEVD
jgi:predicted GNAT superfamily acetyltransferase